jgi:hypothetical protein
MFHVRKILDADCHVFAPPAAHVVLAHLKAQATRRDPEQRLSWKIRLVKGLYKQGWTPEQVRQLFRVLDWIMELPRELQQGFREEIYRYEEERHMPHVNTIESMAKEEGREEGLREAMLELIRTGIKDKFGAAGTKLMPKVRALDDLARLRALMRALVTATDLDAIRALLR